MSRLDERRDAAGMAAGRFLATAGSIADQLVAQAIRDGDRCGWFGFDMDEQNGEWRSVYATIDESLYGGLAGVALFLANAWRVTGDPEHAAAAAGAAREAMRLVRERRSLSPHGWYSGLTGTLWSVGEVSRIVPDLDPPGEPLLQEVLDAPLPAIGDFDIVAGVSGTIVGLLALEAAKPRPEIVAACRSLADWLLDNAVSGPGVGLAWQGEEQAASGAYPLCGLAHGASSVALAFTELDARSDETRYREPALEALRYERQWFSRRHGSWPDLRDANTETPVTPDTLAYPTYWCYGAAGSGLARFRIWTLTGDENALAEANAALFACKMRARDALTAAHDNGADFDMNASVCHGLGSVMELLLYAARIGHDPDALPLARRLGDVLIGRAEGQGEWAGGVVGGGETPGLMLGLSGIGALFLGLHNPGTFYPAGLPPLNGPLQRT